MNGNRNPKRQTLLERIASGTAGIKFILDFFVIVIFSMLDLATF